MASITIRRLEDSTKAKLRVQAARHGRSMEEEAREILKAGLGKKERGGENLAEAIRKRFAKFGGIDLPPMPRGTMREPPDFSGPEYDRS